MTPLTAALTLSMMLTPAYDERPLIRFSKAPARASTVDQVNIGRLETGDGPAAYWFQQITRNNDGHILRSAWTDTATCPAASTALQGLSILTRPESAPGDAQALMRDGIWYTLEADAVAPWVGQRIAMESNMGTPLARWVDEALESLEPCWSAKRPEGYLR